MKSARLEIRLEEELLGRLPSGSRERSAFVRGALEAALGLVASVEARPAAAALGVPAGVPEGGGSTPSGSVSPRAPALEGFKPKVFKCPAHGCDFSALSGRARCGAHGRLVVPA